MTTKADKVLVVGGAGYIGGAVTDALAAAGVPFAVYDNLLYEHQYLKPVEFTYGDVRDTARLAALLPNFSQVIWLAAIVGDAACQVKPALTVAVNQHAVDWLSQHYAGPIIFTSTCSVYGQHEALVDETSPTQPLSLYAQTKLKAEQSLDPRRHLILRLGTSFGLADHFSRLRMDLAVNYMTANAVTRGRLTVFGGTQWRPLIHVKDIGEAIVNCLQRQLSGVYNLATVNLQIRAVGETVQQITDCAVEFTGHPTQDQRDYHVSCERAAASGILPAHPRTVADGVRELADLIRGGRIRYTEHDVYSNERHIANLHNHGRLI